MLVYGEYYGQVYEVYNKYIYTQIHYLQSMSLVYIFRNMLPMTPFFPHLRSWTWLPEDKRIHHLGIPPQKYVAKVQPDCVNFCADKTES